MRVIRFEDARPGEIVVLGGSTYPGTVVERSWERGNAPNPWPRGRKLHGDGPASTGYHPDTPCVRVPGVRAA